jgi:hypothetical protein
MHIDDFTATSTTPSVKIEAVIGEGQTVLHNTPLIESRKLAFWAVSGTLSTLY